LRALKHAIEQYDRAAATYGQHQDSLWTGDPGVALFLQGCRMADDADPTFDVFWHLDVRPCWPVAARSSSVAVRPLSSVRPAKPNVRFAVAAVIRLLPECSRRVVPEIGDGEFQRVR
jgi:hypothetical protein